MEESKEKDVGEEYLCAICMQLYYQPTSTPCKHYFCLPCLTQVLELEQRCPLCRSGIPSTFIPQIDPGYNAMLHQKFPSQMKAREEEIKKREKEILKVRFVYGNTHSLVDPEGESGNKHSWTVFVKAGRNESETAKYIKSVTFRLHPTFYNPVRNISAPPFQVSCIGWGYFSIPITIRWQSNLGLSDTKLDHLLCFEGNGKTVSFFAEFNKKNLESRKEAGNK